MTDKDSFKNFSLARIVKSLRQIEYVVLAENMCNNFKVTNYLRSRVESLIVELNFIFQLKEEQPTLLDYL